MLRSLKILFSINFLKLEQNNSSQWRKILGFHFWTLFQHTLCLIKVLFSPYKKHTTETEVRTYMYIFIQICLNIWIITDLLLYDCTILFHEDLKSSLFSSRMVKDKIGTWLGLNSRYRTKEPGLGIFCGGRWRTFHFLSWGWRPQI